MSSLVIGASGLVGFEFYRQSLARQDADSWHFTYRSVPIKEGFSQLDATDAQKTEELFEKQKPKTVILPAAMAWVDKCEREPGLARKNNVVLLENVLSSMKKNGGETIIFFSTDYLFDGKDGPYGEDAAPNPLNEYGRLKLECEKTIQASGLRHIILRTTGVFGWEKQKKNFLYRAISTLSQKKPLVVPNDQYATPTYVKDLVSSALFLLDNGHSGVFNAVGPQLMGRVELSQKFARAFSLDESFIEGKPTSEFDSVAPRPLKGGFTTEKINSLGFKFRTVEDAVADMKADTGHEFYINA